MSDARAGVPLPKWPFYLTDLVLSAIILYVFYILGPVEGTTDMVIVLGCLFAAAWAAWISITPWLTEHRASTQLAESANLKSSFEQIQSVEKVADLIRQANSQWQLVQDAAGRTVTAAGQIAERMKGETEEFMKFLDSAHSSERAGLKLEVEKLRRMEGDWIKVAVQMLDHIFAITRAAERSGQAQLITQMQQFQNACREAARRIGLVPFTPNLSESFDSRAHQVPDPNFTPPPGSTIGEVLASGFTYQGQLLRRALVMLEGEEPPPAVPVSEPAPETEVLPPQEGLPSRAAENAVPEPRAGLEPEPSTEASSVPAAVEREAPASQSGPDEPAQTESAPSSPPAPPRARPKPASNQKELPLV